VLRSSNGKAIHTDCRLVLTGIDRKRWGWLADGCESQLCKGDSIAGIHQAEKVIVSNLLVRLHGCSSRKIAKVANHVHLIVIPYAMGNVCPRLTTYVLHLNRRLESCDSRHQSGRDARPLQTL
jgi:hypothetical protein